MSGVVAASDSHDAGSVREAPWLSHDRRRVNIVRKGPPIWRWRVPIRVRRARLEAYEGAKGDGMPGRDALLVLEYSDHLVLAVADGVTPTDATPRAGSLDGARHAVHFVLRQIIAAGPDTDPHEALRIANDRLLDEFARPGSTLHDRDLPQAAVVIAVIPGRVTTPSSVIVARAGDCNVWMRRGDRWTLKTPMPLLTEDARAALVAWDAANHDAPRQKRIEEEKRILDDSSWNVTPVGRFREPKFERHIVTSEIDAIALVTDGVDMARFGGRPPLDPRKWLPDVEASEPCIGSLGGRRDDVALLHLRLA